MDLKKLSEPSYKAKRKSRSKNKKAGRPPESRNKETIRKQLMIERALALSTGQELAVEKLNKGMHIMDELVDRYRPIYDDDGNLVQGKHKFNYDRFIGAIRDMHSFAVALVGYQSPKLSATQITTPQPKALHSVLTVNIFDEKRRKLATVVDGERIHQLEDHSNGKIIEGEVIGDRLKEGWPKGSGEEAGISREEVREESSRKEREPFRAKAPDDRRTSPRGGSEGEGSYRPPVSKRPVYEEN